MYKLYRMKDDPSYTVKDVFLAAIDLITARKNRPNLARIYRHLHKIYNCRLAKCEQILDSLIEEGKVVKVTYKGNISYRNAANWKKYTYHVIKNMAKNKVPETPLGFTITNAVMRRPVYLSTGVPYSVLEKAMLSVESGSCKNADDVKEVIMKELKNNTIIRLSNGNFLYKIKPGELDAPALVASEESDASAKSTNQWEVDFEDEIEEMVVEDFEEVEQEVPASETVLKIKTNKRLPYNNDGAKRNSLRKKQSKYDPNEYVLPSVKRNSHERVVNKTTKKSPKKKAELLTELEGTIKFSQPVYQCILCKSYGCKTKSEPMSVCNTCPSRGHPLCIEKEQLLIMNIPYDINSWQCSECKMNKSGKPKLVPVIGEDTEPTCIFCVTPSNKFLGNLMKCSNCSDNYHKKCHKPPITDSTETPWKCINCAVTPHKDEASPIKVEEEFKLDPLPSVSSESPGLIMEVDEAEHKNPDFSLIIKEEQTPDKGQSPKPHKDKSKAKPAASDGCQKVENGLPFTFRVELSKQEEKDILSPPESDKNKLNLTVVPTSTPKDEEIDERPLPDPMVPDPTFWTTNDVYKHFLQYFKDEVAKAFFDQDIDGYALKLMRRTDVIQGMGFTLGLGLQVLMHVKRLQLRTNDRRLIWKDES